MSEPLTPPHLRRAAFAVLTCLGLSAPAAFGQAPANEGESPQVAQTPQAPPRRPYSDMVPGGPGLEAGQPAPEAPAPSFAPGPAAESAAAPAAPLAGYGAAAAAGAFGAAGTNVAASDGYIDSAIIRSRFRMRYDAAYDLNSPDRAEFFYAKCGCFGNPANFPGAIVNGQFDPALAQKMGFDRRALGPQHRTPLVLTPGGRPITFTGEYRVDYQEATPYLEYAPTRTTSMFIEMPARFINPTLNRNAYGWSDMNLGFKHAFVANPDQFYTFQFRVYVPTGSGEKGLGTNHATLEPGLLVFQRLGERLYFSGQFRDWIPVHATDFAGNVLIYGAGLFYNIVLTDHFRVAPVNEFVGWTILSGKEFVPTQPTPESASNWTIVNYKIGLRFALGNYSQAGGGSALNDRHSIYVGYGRALTGNHWYKDMFRLEYDFWF